MCDANDELKPMFGFPIGRWQRVFAWLPTDTLDAGWKWLTFVERRRCQLHWFLSGGPDQWWQYRGVP